MNQNRKFSWRALTSVMVTFCFLILAFSGAILFITPPGRVANWTGWTILGATKGQWSAVHIWFGTLFLIAGFFHTWLNWRPLIGYFKNQMSRAFAFRPEWVLGFVFCVAVAVGTMAEVPPFSTFVDWQEEIKNSWEANTVKDPVPPHAELMTVAELAETIERETEPMLENLRAAGATDVTASTIVADIGEAMGKTPREIYYLATGQKLTEQRGQGRGQGGGGGAGGGGGGQGNPQGKGRMTLAEFCEVEGLNIEDIIDQLAKANIVATPDSTLRELAFNNGMRPPELMEMLGVKY